MITFGPVARRLLAILPVAIGLAAVPVFAAYADENFEPRSGVAIEDASLSGAGVGQNARLRLRIDNASGRKITLLGLRAEVAQSAALIVSAPDAVPQVVPAFVLLDQETLDLESSHIGAELHGLRRPILGGETIEFELIFALGAFTATAHVH